MLVIYSDEIKVNGVTSYENAVKLACKDIAYDNGIYNNNEFYGSRNNNDIKDELINRINHDYKVMKELYEDCGYGHYDYDTFMNESYDESLIRIYKYDDLMFKDIKLIPEPDNKYDKNAIKILIFNHHVGYVLKNKTRTLKKYLNNDQYHFNMLGRIVGGPYKTIDDYGDIITVTDLNVGFRIDILVIETPKKEIQQVIPFKQQLQSIEKDTVDNKIHRIKNINSSNTNYNETVIDKLINKWNNFKDNHTFIYKVLKGIVWVCSMTILLIFYLTMMIGVFFGVFPGRTKDRPRKAKKRGVKKGNKDKKASKYNEKQIIEKYLRKESSVRDISNQLNVSTATIYNVLKRNNIRINRKK